MGTYPLKFRIAENPSEPKLCEYIFNASNRVFDNCALRERHTLYKAHLFHAVEPAEALGASQWRKDDVVPTTAAVAHLQVVRLRGMKSARPALALALIQQMLGPGLPHRRGGIVLRVALHLPTRRRLEAPSRARRRGHRRGEPLHEGAEHGHH